MEDIAAMVESEVSNNSLNSTHCSGYDAMQFSIVSPIDRRSRQSSITLLDIWSDFILRYPVIYVIVSCANIFRRLAMAACWAAFTAFSFLPIARDVSFIDRPAANLSDNTSCCKLVSLSMAE